MSFLFDSKTKLRSIEVIEIEICSQIHDGIPSVTADLLTISAVFQGTIEEIRAIMFIKCLIETLWHEIEILVKLWECWEHIKTPIGGTVTHDESLQVNHH